MIGIVNYGAGNIFSLSAALDRINVAYGMINQPEELADYTHVIIPGVGHAGAAMKRLEESGLAEPVKALKVPVLGICVGMQLLSSFSEEGSSDMLNLMPVRTLHFENRIAHKIPHMGWNRVELLKTSALFDGIPDESYFYFVHSYFLEYNPTFTLAKTQYGLSFAAAVIRNNFFGVQFHPEKSGEAGEQLLKNFSML